MWLCFLATELVKVSEKQQHRLVAILIQSSNFVPFFLFRLAECHVFAFYGSCMDTTPLALDVDPALGIDDPLPSKLAPHYNSGDYKAEAPQLECRTRQWQQENEEFHLSLIREEKRVRSAPHWYLGNS